MFDNIGGKIKMFATITCVIGIVLSIIYGLIAMTENGLAGFIIILIGALISWVSSFTLYGFGEIVDSLDMINSNLCETYRLIEKLLPKENKDEAISTHIPRPTPTVKKVSTGDWICKQCSTKNDEKAQFCKDCGAYK